MKLFVVILLLLAGCRVPDGTRHGDHIHIGEGVVSADPPSIDYDDED